MPKKLTPHHYRKLIKIFELEGFRIKRQKGDHIIMTKTGIKRPVVIKISPYQVPVTHIHTRGLVNEFFIGEDNPMLLYIPALVLHGFKAYGFEPAYVVNTITQPYNHKELDEFRIDPFGNDIPYDWALQQG